MARGEKALCAGYALIAVAAFITTQINNIAFFLQPDNGGAGGFISALYANPAVASITNDLLWLALAASIFMLLEGRRLRIRYLWAYLVLSGLIAISVTFPLFLIARQFALVRERGQAG